MWLTNKKTGARFNTDWLDEDANRKEQQIQANTHQANTIANSDNVVNGRDLSETWKRREDKFDYAIDDIVDAQGFNGKPTVVSPEEFDAYVRDSNMIANRGYIAPDKETLDAYHESLVNGEWYINCTVGGSINGQGMYSAGNYGTELSENSKLTAEHCASGPYGRVETFTLRSNAKIVTQEELLHRKEEVSYNLAKKLIGRTLNSSEDKVLRAMTMPLATSMSDAMEAYSMDKSLLDRLTKEVASITPEWKSKLSKLPSDNGQLAALFGYDAIAVSIGGREDKHFIILNRTKLVIKGD